MKLKFLGTGTSQGIPVIGSKHPVCLSNNIKDKRLRSSVLLTTPENKKILIDCGPDFRTQMLQNNESKIDAVLLTHEHNDHVIGLDDLRPLIFKNKKNMPIFAQQRVLNDLKIRFPYAFTKTPYPGAPQFNPKEIERQFWVEDCLIESIDVMHGTLPIVGYKLGKLAYITDANFISEEAKNQLKNLDYLIINCLRHSEIHHSHFILPQVEALFMELKPKKMFLTHISHHLGFHDEVNAFLANGMELAYDGLEINFE